MMVILFVAAALAAPSQAATSSSRQAFNTCIQEATSAAKQGKVAPDAYEAFVMGRCEAQATAFKNAMISFDVANGVPRKTAASDAQIMVEDRLAGAKDNYALRMDTPKP